MEIYSVQCVMRTGTHTGRTTWIGVTQVTFGRLQDWLAGGRIHNDMTISTAYFDHANIVVGAGRGTGRTANAGIVVDHDTAAHLATVNRTSGAPDHADRVRTVHAGVGDHPVIECFAVSQEARIAAMR